MSIGRRPSLLPGAWTVDKKTRSQLLLRVVRWEASPGGTRSRQRPCESPSPCRPSLNKHNASSKTLESRPHRCATGMVRSRELHLAVAIGFRRRRDALVGVSLRNCMPMACFGSWRPLFPLMTRARTDCAKHAGPSENSRIAVAWHKEVRGNVECIVSHRERSNIR